MKRQTTVICLALAVMALPAFAAADHGPAGPEAAAGKRVQALDTALDEVLALPAYQWRLPREARPSDPTAGRGRLALWLDRVINWLVSLLRWLGARVEALLNWIERLFTSRQRRHDLPRQQDAWHRYLRPVALATLVMLLGWLSWMLVRFIRSARRPAAPPETVTPVVDLDDERLTADRLPLQEWLTLAEQMQSEGRLRHCLRALFLAALAALGQRGWLLIAPCKSNRDYARELAPRAGAGLRLAFATQIRLFEQSWYGDHPVSPDLLREGQSTLGRILDDAE